MKEKGSECQFGTTST